MNQFIHSSAGDAQHRRHLHDVQHQEQLVVILIGTFVHSLLLTSWSYRNRDMISFSLQTCVERSITVRRCKNCGRYFAQTGRVSAEYCDRPPLDGQSSCRSMGAFQQWTLKQADDPVFKIYRREYKRRFAWIKAGRISDSEFYAWSEQAREQKKKCDEGAITAEEFGRWLKES